MTDDEIRPNDGPSAAWSCTECRAHGDGDAPDECPECGAGVETLTLDGGRPLCSWGECERTVSSAASDRRCPFHPVTPDERITDGGTASPHPERDLLGRADDRPRTAECVATYTTSWGPSLPAFEQYSAAVEFVADTLDRLAEAEPRLVTDGGRDRGYDLDGERLLVDDDEALDAGLRGRRHEALQARLAGLGEVQAHAADRGNDALYRRVSDRKTAIRRELVRRVAERRRRDEDDGRAV